MALIAPLVVRFTLNGSYDGSFTWANIWDVDVLADVGEDRGALASDYARLILDVWDTELALSLSSLLRLDSVSYVDLNSADGATGTETLGITQTPPYVGAQSGSSSPLNVSALLVKAGSSQRGSRNGRMYVPGLPEADASAADINSGPLGVLNDRADNFLIRLTDPESLAPASFQPMIVHTRNDGTPSAPNIVYNGKSRITSLVAQPRLATQRRRLRR